LTFDLLTLKVVSESHVTWATCVPILVFLGRSVLELYPTYATNVRYRRQTDDRRQTKASLNAPNNTVVTAVHYFTFCKKHVVLQTHDDARGDNSND